MTTNPFLDENGWDHVTQTRHCVDCGLPMIQRGVVLRDHALMNWQHWCFISYPEVLATTETGHTMEGVVNKPSRRVLAPVPKQTAVQFCLDCMFKAQENGCVVCGKPVDPNDEHSSCEYLEKYVDNSNRNYKVMCFHHDCLPALFTGVRDYKEQYR